MLGQIFENLTELLILKIFHWAVLRHRAGCLRLEVRAPGCRGASIIAYERGYVQGWQGRSGRFGGGGGVGWVRWYRWLNHYRQIPPAIASVSRHSVGEN